MGGGGGCQIQFRAKNHPPPVGDVAPVFNKFEELQSSLKMQTADLTLLARGVRRGHGGAGEGGGGGGSKGGGGEGAKGGIHTQKLH
jgi:hypothetical protein